MGLVVVVVLAAGCGEDEADRTAALAGPKAEQEAVIAVRSMVTALARGDIAAARAHTCRTRAQGWREDEAELRADLDRLDAVRGRVVEVEAEAAVLEDLIIEDGGPGRIDVAYRLITADGVEHQPLYAETVVEDDQRVACTLILPETVGSADDDAARRALADIAPAATSATVRQLASVTPPDGFRRVESGPRESSSDRIREGWTMALKRNPVTTARVTVLRFGSPEEALDSQRRHLDDLGLEALEITSLEQGTRAVMPSSTGTGMQSADMGPYLADQATLIGPLLVSVATIAPTWDAAEALAATLSEAIRATAAAHP